MKISMYGDNIGNTEITSKFPEGYEKSVNAFLHFLRCGVNEYTTNSTRMTDGMDIRKITALFEYYGVAPALYSILDLTALNCEDELLSAGLKAKYYYTQFLEDFNHIADFFEKSNIWFVPLENAVLLDCWNYKKYYINDNAFLIAPEGMAVLDRLFQIPDEEWHLSEYKIIPDETTEHCVTCYTNLNMSKMRIAISILTDCSFNCGRGQQVKISVPTNQKFYIRFLCYQIMQKLVKTALDLCSTLHISVTEKADRIDV